MKEERRKQLENFHNHLNNYAKYKWKKFQPLTIPWNEMILLLTGWKKGWEKKILSSSCYSSNSPSSSSSWKKHYHYHDHKGCDHHHHHIIRKYISFPPSLSCFFLNITWIHGWKLERKQQQQQKKLKRNIFFFFSENDRKIKSNS